MRAFVRIIGHIVQKMPLLRSLIGLGVAILQRCHAYGASALENLLAMEAKKILVRLG